MPRAGYSVISLVTAPRARGAGPRRRARAEGEPTPPSGEQECPRSAKIEPPGRGAQPRRAEKQDCPRPPRYIGGRGGGAGRPACGPSPWAANGPPSLFARADGRGARRAAGGPRQDGPTHFKGSKPGPGQTRARPPHDGPRRPQEGTGGAAERPRRAASNPPPGRGHLPTAGAPAGKRADCDLAAYR